MTRRTNTHEDTDAAVERTLRACQTPVIAADLARRCGLSKATMTRSLHRLERDGKIRKTRRTRVSAWLQPVEVTS